MESVLSKQKKRILYTQVDAEPDPLRDSEKQSIPWLRKQPQEMTKRHTHLKRGHVTKSGILFALLQIILWSHLEAWSRHHGTFDQFKSQSYSCESLGMLLEPISTDPLTPKQKKDLDA